jgi:hypothetical protein
VRTGKINCTQVLLKFHEYSAPVHELSLNTTNRCTQTQLIIKNCCTQLKYSSTHCNQGRSCDSCFFPQLSYSVSVDRRKETSHPLRRLDDGTREDGTGWRLSEDGCDWVTTWIGGIRRSNGDTVLLGRISTSHREVNHRVNNREPNKTRKNTRRTNKQGRPD